MARSDRFYEFTSFCINIFGKFWEDAVLGFSCSKSVLNQVLQAQVVNKWKQIIMNEQRIGMPEWIVSHRLHTRVGTITLNVPHRSQRRSTNSLVVTSEQALILAMMEMVVNSVSSIKSMVTEEPLREPSFLNLPVSRPL
ncbi:hypothetical protein P7H22_09930 [Paenibacillus larvae]|nr:hypothetical protein [Paenibacillus larvae]MDT2240580.1 hypothetical protein [Paenibacillus larvae]